MSEKKWWQSKTIWGAAITVTSVLGGFFGLELTADEQALLTDTLVAAVGAVGGLVGAGVSVYGRVKADKSIK